MESVLIPMVVRGLGSITFGQWTEELTPLDGFDMAVHEEGVDHEVVARNWAAGLVIVLVKRRVVAATGIIDLILCGATLNADPFGRICGIAGDGSGAIRTINENIRP